MTTPKAKLAGLTLIAVLCAGFTLGLTAPASAHEHYSPLWDTACGTGAEITEGCRAVLARTIVDAASYPWSAIGLINFTGFGIRASCTGALIGERLVLTAAHCLYLLRIIEIGRVGEWISAPSVHFVAGYQRGAYVSHSTAIRYVVPKAFPEEDWALVELRDPIGLSAGYLGWAVLNPAGLERALRSGARVALAGYPQIRRHVMSVDMDCKGAHFRDGQANFVHKCADMKGDSGGPLLLLRDGKATIVAVASRWQRPVDEVISVAFPVATFYTAILDMLGGDRSVKDMDGLAGLPGRLPGPRQPTALGRASIKEILRAKGLSGTEAFQEAKKYIGRGCIGIFEEYEEQHSDGLETAFAYAQDKMGGPYACGGAYSMYVENAKDNALYYCEKDSEEGGITAPCEILALGNKIVWEGETVRSK